MVDQPFPHHLTTTDWNDEWMALQQARNRAHSATFWDEKAHHFGSRSSHNPYVEAFIQHMELKGGEAVLDMGCGNGALALPLAAAGHEVIAADFSQGMLEILKEEAAATQIDSRITPLLMSWSDSWEQHGVSANSVDVAIASRSITTPNLKESLLKLTQAARRKACITLTTGPSPRCDQRVVAELGLQAHMGRDFQYAVNILIHEGFLPRVSYITSAKDDVFDSFEDAYESLSRMVRDVTQGLSEKEQTAALAPLESWLRQDLVPTYEDGRERLRLSQPRMVTWAFISWDTGASPES